MTYLLAAPPHLRPYLEKLLPLCPRRPEICYLPETPAESRRKLRELAETPGSSDTLLVLGGADALPEEGLTAAARQILIPRVHNEAALLLGSDEAYRALFLAYDGAVCWMLPQTHRPLTLTPWESGSALCYIADTQLGLWDTGDQARAVARAREWDFFQTASELHLLERILRGCFQEEDVFLVPVGESVKRSAMRELLMVV